MSDKIVRIGKDPNAGTPESIIKGMLKTEILDEIDSVVILWSLKEGGNNIAFSDQSSESLCYTNSFFTAFNLNYNFSFGEED